MSKQPQQFKNRIIEYGEKPADQFLAHPKNARMHPLYQRETMKAALDTVGFVAPVLEAASGYLVDGHERIWQALQNGNALVPYVKLDITEEEEAYVLATFDPLTALANYDAELLDGLLQEVNSDSPAIQRMLAELAESNGLYVDTPTVEDPGAQVDRAGELQEKWPVKRGDLWLIGEHRLLCGDSTNADDVARLMGGEKADAMINDAPYGMRLDADFSGAKTNLKFASEKGAFGGKKYDNVIGDHEDYDARPILKLLDYIKEQFWFGADYYSNTLPDTMHEGCWLVWDKRLEESADLMYGSCFELIWSKTRHKRDVLRHKWAGIFGVEQEQEKKRFHPTQKPTVLIVDIINRYIDSGAVVIDSYAGSGTTLVACEQTGRKGRGIEIAEKYCSVILERMSGMGLHPRLSE